MTDLTNVSDVNEINANDTTVDSTAIDSNSVIDDLKQQNQAMQNKLNELLAETKKAKNKAREELEQKERIKLEKAKKDGDYEQLLKSSEKERSDLLNKYTELTSKISQEKIRNESLKIATELADSHNADILSEFISKRLKYTDDEVKVLDSNGELTVSSVEELKREFQNSDKFKSLLRGSKASGGNAQGSGKSTEHKSLQVDRKTFDGMTQEQRVNHFKNGGTVFDV